MPSTAQARATVNDCPCEPLEEHLRPCEATEACLACDRVAACEFACPACRRQIKLLAILQRR